jgi:hypothetical protein
MSTPRGVRRLKGYLAVGVLAVPAVFAAARSFGGAVA